MLSACYSAENKYIVLWYCGGGCARFAKILLLSIDLC